MMKLRKANIKDIPFIVDGILEIERVSEKTNTYSNLFGSTWEESQQYLKEFFLDQENFDTELSLNTYIIAEIDGQAAGCCALIYTNKEYGLNKSELFPIHLNPEHLKNFIEKSQKLPKSNNITKNKHYIEYIYVNQKFRKKGIAKKMIEHQANKLPHQKHYINVLSHNLSALHYYKNLGYLLFSEIQIDHPENNIYPAISKIILSK